MKKLVEGKKYRIIHKSGTQRIERESVLVYLRESSQSYYFSFRPQGGTQKFHKDTVMEILKVNTDAELYMNKKHIIKEVE